MRAPLGLVLALLSFAAPVTAQGLFGASPHQPSSDDKTGTNPLNLQQQIDVSNSHVTLEGLFLNTTTYRHAVPLLERRLRLTGNLPFTYSNITGVNAGGLGDLGADVEWTPWLSPRGGLVAGLRTTWSTATESGVGLGAHTLMPYGQFVIGVGPRGLVAPFVAQRFSVSTDDFAPAFQDTIVGAYAAWRLTPRMWVGTQPQLVFDLEQDRTAGDISGEFGLLVLDRLATYVRPSVGFGTDGNKPYAWGVTVGVRFVP